MKQILAVDDNSINLRVIKDMLQDEYKVIPTLSGRVALQFLEKHKPDLILLDVMMPEMDGIAAYKEIRKTDNGKEAPIIFLSASEDTDIIQACMEQGAAGYIVKPFKTQDINKKIKSIFEKKEI
ncbi:MAG: response regulator [Lachnospiraceae bacterium]